MRIFQPSFVLLILLLFMSPSKAGQPLLSEQQDQLLQLTAAGHVLGFKQSGFYVAAANHLLHVQFVGSTGVSPRGLEVQKSDDGNSQLAAVAYIDLWPGINLRYESVEHGIAMSTWEISPGSDMNQIRLRYNSPVNIEGDGSLKIDYETGWMKVSAPIAWQEIDGHHLPVDVAFRLFETAEKEQLLGFHVGHYDPTYPLIIDPTLTWNTFMGSTGFDTCTSMARDDSGNIYLTGYSSASWGMPVNEHRGGNDAFAAKLDANGNLIWNTFMGSSSTDEGQAIAVDNNGFIYVTGQSGGTWGGDDAFVAKLDADGIRLWHTFLGSISDEDQGNAITVDDSGSIFVAGRSDGSWGWPVDDHIGNNVDDAFVAKLDANGLLIWNTFMGSSGYDYANAIAVSESGKVYVVGESYATWGMPKHPHTGDGYKDVFAAKLDAGGGLEWNTFMGGEDPDRGTSLIVDDNENVYIVGDSYVTWGDPNSSFMGYRDAFVAKLNDQGIRIFNTFMGSSGVDSGWDITIDLSGNIYVVGTSDGAWGNPISAYKGSMDAFAVKLDNEGARIWNTFIGSSSQDDGIGIAVDPNDNIYVAGNSYATWGKPIIDYAGDSDVFIAKPRTTRCTLIIFSKKNGKSIPICI
jgi:hypothetical protein